MKKEAKKSSVEENQEIPEPAETTEKVEKEASAAAEEKVGTILKSVRLREGRKITDVAQRLCIRKVYLEAIEANDYANIPDYPYGPGFIRSYAEYLGLDGEDLAEKFKVENDVFSGRSQAIYVPEPQIEATVPGRKYLLISLLALVAVYAGWYFYNGYQNLPAEEPLSEDIDTAPATDFPLIVEDFVQVDENMPAEISETAKEAPALAVIDTTTAPQVSVTPQVTVTEDSFGGLEKQEENTVSEAAPTENVPPSVVLKFNTDTWVEVKNDKIIYISKVLKSGEEYTIPHDKDLKLSTGNAGGFDIFVNGVRQPSVGNPGMVKKNISVDELLSAAQH